MFLPSDRRLLSAAVLAAVLAVSCSVTPPGERTVSVAAAGCGDGFDTTVAGVVVGHDLVVTVAHGVAQADAIVVTRNGVTFAGTVVGLDSRTDLALVSVPGVGGDEIVPGEITPGRTVTIAGGLASGDLGAVVTRTATIRIERVLGTDRVERAGIELAAGATVGDSGAGVFDDEGRLLGVLFAVNDDGSEAVWATAVSEVVELLEAPRARWICDPSRSRLVPGDQP